VSLRALFRSREVKRGVEKLTILAVIWDNRLNSESEGGRFCWWRHCRSLVSGAEKRGPRLHVSEGGAGGGLRAAEGAPVSLFSTCVLTKIAMGGGATG